MSRQPTKRGNGEGSIHRYKSRPGWRAQAFLSGGRRPTKMVPTIKAGRDWIRSQHDLDAKQRLSPRPEPLLFGEWLQIWMKARKDKVAPHTFDNEQSLARRYLVPLDDLPLTAITEGQIDDWLSRIDHQGKVAKPGIGTPHVVRQCFSLASVIFRDAVRHRLLETSPMARVPRPKVPPPSPKFLEEHEVKAVLEACVASGDPRALAVILMARLGLRRNEALGLIWDDLDFEAGVLNVTMQLGRTTDNAQLIRRELKTLTSKRTLRISGQLLDLLRQVESSRALSGFETDFLITLDGKGPTDPDAMSRWLGGIGKSLNIHVTPHRLRHSAATLMLNHGVPLEAVGRVLGHGDLKTTAVYARVLDSSSDRAVDVLAQVLDR